MSRFFSASILVVAAMALCATGSLANIPDPELSEVPDMMTLSTTTPTQGLATFDFVVVVEGQGGPVANSLVEVEFAPSAEDLIAWWDGQTHPLLSATTDLNGEARFVIYGGGCIDPDEYDGGSFIWQVRADGIVLDEGGINSPDPVNDNGRLPTDTDFPNCKEDPPGTWTTTAGLSDAVFHTRPIKLGLIEVCTKFTPPFNDPVGLADGILLTPYLKFSGTCETTAWCSSL